MRYVIMAVAGIMALTNWLSNTDDGHRFKQTYLSGRDHPEAVPVD